MRTVPKAHSLGSSVCETEGKVFMPICEKGPQAHLCEYLRSFNNHLLIIYLAVLGLH